jgi:Ca-activated chloride channel family protein
VTPALRGVGAFLALAAAALLAACGEDKPAPPRAAAQAAVELSVLAGSELKDIEPLLPQIQRATGVALKLHYTGTLDAVEKIQAGEAHDLAWLSSNRYAMITPGVKERIRASERTMITPVVLGLKESKARELGWLNNPEVTWKDIAEAAGKSRFTFGMTSPTSSNTGFSGLLGLAAALSGKGDALEAKDIDGKRLAAFFGAQRLTAGSSGWLVDAFLKDQSRLDGMVNYANVFLALNRSGQLKEPFALIYPKEGIVTADYPLMLLDESKRAAYEKVVAYIRGAAFQKAMLDSTLRRPVTADVAVDPKLYPATLIELPFPSSYAVVNAILDSFDNELRRPADATFVLDVSGSMKGGRLDSLKAAMTALAEGDASISGRYARFRNRERIVIVPFDNAVRSRMAYEMGTTRDTNDRVLQQVKGAVAGLEAQGGTAIYSAVHSAYGAALARRNADRGADRYYSIVIMTDGENRDGEKYEDFERWYRGLKPADQGIRVFAILFGDAKPAELESLAQLTGGRVFDGRKAGSLAAVFREIRSYQ